MTKIVGHCLVFNEENYLWFAVESVIKELDYLLIWDTGSKDNSVKVIKFLQDKYPQKIKFKEVGKVDGRGLMKLRQQMIDETKEDWILILDGDEVWWEESINKLTETINQKGDSLDAIVVPFINLVGDIYHYQDEKAGKYELLGKKGFLSIKAINRKIPGLHVDKPYPHEGFFDGNNVLIQNRHRKKLEYLNAPFLHFSHLERSRKVQSRNKSKFDLGKKFAIDFKYPEVLFIDPPKFQNSIWEKRQKSFIIKSALRHPLQKIWRRLK